MNYLDFIGQTLDGKYLMTRELGRGGMGTVYLATHLGTERPVAVKIIAPQFMQRAEFVERFRREARAAGRLRHPNVVDVTDFGFADSKDGQVAYLVMEYLDGCTLGEILDEEKNLPVAWTLDILEQVCSAVQEAHEQGIIHRDLKPDNIWLEPNQRGGYTVKVLDFGIAKLEENEAVDGNNGSAAHHPKPTYFQSSRKTFSGAHDGTFAGEGSSTLISEASTIVQTADHGTSASDGAAVQPEPVQLEKETAIYDAAEVSIANQDTIGTRMLSDGIAIDPDRTGHQTAGKSLLDSHATASLTRVGAVLGTPLYMSPEQCRGEHLDQRSDIYSLGVIAYQMLSGGTPFSGDFKDVMESHKTVEPPPLAAKKVRRKMKRAIHSALSKDAEHRPLTAAAFASELRSRSEGIWGLLRRALVIYSEHLPKFVLLTAFFELPVIVLTLMQIAMSFLKVGHLVSETTGQIAVGISVFLLTLATAFCVTLIIGAIVWIVTQYLAVPLRPVRLRPALTEVRRKWKIIGGSGAISAVAPFIGAIVGSIAGFVIFGAVAKLISVTSGIDMKAPIVGAVGAAIFGIAAFFYIHVRFMLVGPVVMMENGRMRDAFRRSNALAGRAFLTALSASLIMFLIPMVLAGSLSFFVNIAAKVYDPEPQKPAEIVKQQDGTTASAEPVDSNVEVDKPGGIRFSLGGRTVVNGASDEMDMQTMIRRSILESLIQIIWLPLQILVLSFSAIIVALLYLKTRLAGGESMNDLLERFEDDEKPRRKWQERVRQRLIQSGRIPSKP